MDQSSVTILLVEDDTEFRLLLEALLEEEGYNVIGAASGEEALSLAKNHSYDLVVTDVKLGGIDGLDTLSELKRGRSELQSLVITGYATEADSIRAISLGVGNYLRKPFKLPDFLRAVSDVVQHIYKEREQLEFQQAVLETALWALQLLSERATGTESQRLKELAATAERVAIQRGLSTTVGRQIRLAVLATRLHQSGIEVDLPFLIRILPEHTRWLIGQLGSQEDSENHEIKIARQALKLFERQGAGLGGELEEAFSPLAAAGPDLADGPKSQEVGRLLALAKALEVSGDIAAASRVLQDFDEQAQASNPLTLFYQARVRWMEGDDAQALELLEAAAKASTDLSSRARIKLEGGVLLADLGRREQALDWLQQAVDAFEELQNSAETCRAKLALQAARGAEQPFEEGLLDELLLPGRLEPFLSSAHWLFPYLIRLPESAEVSRGLLRLTRDAAHSVSRCLQSPRLPLEARLRGLRLIEKVGNDGYDDLLQELMLDPEKALRDLALQLLQEHDSVRLAPVLRLYSLGTLTTWLGDRRVPDKGWTGSKPQFLLIYLAQQNGQFVSQERLLDLFWQDSSSPNKSLNQTLVTIRKALRSPDWPEKIDYVERRGTLVGLNPEHRTWHDASLLEEVLDSGDGFLREGNRRRAADCFQQAMELDRGEYLQPCYDDWAVRFRETLNLKLMNGLTSLADIRLNQSRPQEALPPLLQVLAKDPFHSGAHKSLFEAHLALEQPLEVVTLFERLESKMQRELELEPDLELVRLYHTAKLKL